MKLLRLLSFFFLMASSPQQLFAQLSNTKWITNFNIPQELSCYLRFGEDTVDMINVQDDAVLEQMSYVVKSDTLTLFKINGGSPCDNDAKGIYRWKIDADKLKLLMISDDCEARSAAGFDGADLQRVILASSAKKD